MVGWGEPLPGRAIPAATGVVTGDDTSMPGWNNLLDEEDTAEEESDDSDDSKQSKSLIAHTYSREDGQYHNCEGWPIGEEGVRTAHELQAPTAGDGAPVRNFIEANFGDRHYFYSRLQIHLAQVIAATHSTQGNDAETILQDTEWERDDYTQAAMAPLLEFLMVDSQDVLEFMREQEVQLDPEEDMEQFAALLTENAEFAQELYERMDSSEAFGGASEPEPEEPEAEADD